MREIDKILNEIEQHIQNHTYSEFETDKLELKDLSNSDNWNELYKTICAFLNSRGGIIILGIKESIKEKKYCFTGFNPDNESKIKEISNKFSDENSKPVDIISYINPNQIEIKHFLNGFVCIIFVEKLPEDKKFIFYKGYAYERQLTGDHKIPKDKIKAQSELAESLRNAKELEYVSDATLQDLDIERLNDFIIRLNKDVKVETLKADIISAQSFLTRKKFIRGLNPTLLGMLVCGKNIFDFIGSRCQVDCYFETGNEIAADKKVYKDNIINLMESSISYIFSKINTGISVEKGGSRIYEYPERIIRETVNNALAHRDYSINKFVNININVNKYIEIRNPGRFRQQQQIRLDDGNIQIRRIFPIPKPSNPNLADILKSYDRWEGKGWGMSSLTNFSLNNTIDIPYYRIYSEDDIGLFINQGRILDDDMNNWLSLFSKFINTQTKGINLTEEQKTVLAYFYKSEIHNRLEKYTIILTPDNNHFEAIKVLESFGLIYKYEKSPELYPVYLVHRTLIKTDFYDELRVIYGGSFDILNSELKEILVFIYKYSQYSLIGEFIDVNLITTFLYSKNIKSDKDLNIFKRKARRICNKLVKDGFLLKDIKNKTYKINKKFIRTESEYD